jgi:hypothetical protein
MPAAIITTDAAATAAVAILVLVLVLVLLVPASSAASSSSRRRFPGGVGVVSAGSNGAASVWRAHRLRLFSRGRAYTVGGSWFLKKAGGWSGWR